jgi:pimeloyl-ACP methyl ester carboxylesterase
MTAHKAQYSVEKVKLGGDDQWISIRTTDTTNPVLLFLHGGPGTAEMPLVREYNHGLEERFTVVVLDERGAGKSFHAGKDDAKMRIEQFVSDIHELTALLKGRFGHELIYLMGHSWGSILGVLAAQAYPEDYRAYIGIGQEVNVEQGECLCYRFTLGEAVRRGDRRAQRRLRKIGEPIKGLYRRPIRDLLVQRAYLAKFGGALYGKKGSGGAIKVVLRAPEYSLANKVNYLRGSLRSMKLLWREPLARIDFLSSATKFKVPVYFCVGRHDYNTPFTLVERYFDCISAPSKKLFWFECSAHSPNFEEPEAFQKAIVGILDERVD